VLVVGLDARRARWRAIVQFPDAPAHHEQERDESFTVSLQSRERMLLKVGDPLVRDRETTDDTRMNMYLLIVWVREKPRDRQMSSPHLTST